MKRFLLMLTFNACTKSWWNKRLADKTLADLLSTAKSAKVFSHQCFVLYGNLIWNHLVKTVNPYTLYCQSCEPKERFISYYNFVENFVTFKTF